MACSRQFNQLLTHLGSLNIFSSETTASIEAQFHMESPWDGGTNVYSNGPGHMTQIADMPIYGKNLKKIFFSKTKRPMTVKLGMQHRVYSNDDPGLTVTILRQGPIWSLMLLDGKKIKQWIFRNYCCLWFKKRATYDRSDKKFLLNQNCVPWALYAPLPWGYIHVHVFNHEKNIV